MPPGDHCKHSQRDEGRGQFRAQKRLCGGQTYSDRMIVASSAPSKKGKQNRVAGEGSADGQETGQKAIGRITEKEAPKHFSAQDLCIEYGGLQELQFLLCFDLWCPCTLRAGQSFQVYR